MKKLSFKELMRFIKKSRWGNLQKKGDNRSYKSKKKKYFWVSVWDGGEVMDVRCLGVANPAPNQLCFYQNAAETIPFMKAIRSKLSLKSLPNGKRGRVWIKKHKRKKPSILSYYDFSTIDSISVAAALVLAANYDRARSLVNGVPPVINLHLWKGDVLKTLVELGFFELLGHVENDSIAEIYSGIGGGDYRIIRMMTGKNSSRLGGAAKAISSLIEYVCDDYASDDPIILAINSAIGEAMINVARHAYPEKYVADSPYLTLGRWWMTARADRADRRLTIVIYDQGASIPHTLPERPWFQPVVDMLRFVVNRENPTYPVDHQYIAHSMEEGSTQTKERGRGKGLPQMRELIDICGKGRLRILSRAGLYVYDADEGARPISLSNDLEGTLVEWELALPPRRVV